MGNWKTKTTRTCIRTLQRTSPINTSSVMSLDLVFGCRKMPQCSFDTLSYNTCKKRKINKCNLIWKKGMTQATSWIINSSYLPLHIPLCMLPEWHNVDAYSLLCLANIPHESSQICLPDIFNLQLFLVPSLQTWGVIWDRMRSESTDGERGWDNMVPRRAQFLCPCLVLISLERQRWPCWVKAPTSRATGLDSWPWSGRWEVTREVGVGSAYVGLQRARERGNVCVCLCCREIGKECLSACVSVFQCVCALCVNVHRPPVARSILWKWGVMLRRLQLLVHVCVRVCALAACWPVISPVERAGPPLSDNQRGQAEGRGGLFTAP